MSSILTSGGSAGERLGASKDNWRQPVSENPAFTCLRAARRVLMLQGPIGPFFDRIAQWLQSRGTEVQRVVFQGGDAQDCRAVAPIRFTAPPSAWPAFLGELLAEYQPDCLVLFGQGRLYHKVALERARAMDLPVVVMEEGYFRPGFVTMELGGVNGYSTTLDRFEWTPGEADASLQPATTGAHFQKMAWHASQHYIALHRQRHEFPDYQHHRSEHLRRYAFYWTRSWLRKGLRRGRDRRFQQWLFDSAQPYFFVPLQLEGDSQITQHSRYASNAEFILNVLTSFAAHGTPGSLLVFKQHPHARGGPGHHKLISSLAERLGVGQRVHHMVEGDTPQLAEHSLGTVLINSTVGLQALERGSPLMVMGDAPYKQPALTFPGHLDDFWRERQVPEAELTRHFLAQVKNLTQMPASVYALREEPLCWGASSPLSEGAK